MLATTLLLSVSAVAPKVPTAPFELALDPRAPEVAFRAPLEEGSVFVTGAGEVVYALAAAGGGGWSLVECFDGARARPVGVEETETRVNRFTSDDEALWTHDAPTLSRVDLGSVWPGVRVDLLARGANVEKRFFVGPGASPAAIRLSLRGACELRVDERGALVAGTGAGEVEFTPPEAWQIRDGERERIAVRYVVEGASYGFEVGEFDPARELVIDPLLQATYLGGSGFDSIDAMAIDPTSGAVYVTGRTNSPNFPGTAGGAFSSAGGGFDVFVARLSNTLTTLLSATYYGAIGEDLGTGIAVGSGGVYVCGSTRSASLPGTAGGADSVRSGAMDGFVARFNSSLSVLVNATYLGGTEPFSDEAPTDLALDALDGSVVVVGSTYATDFPATALSSEPASHGGMDAFASRLHSSLSSFVVSTYIGGNQNDYARAVVVQSGTGHVFVAGGTDSADMLTQLGTGGADNSLSNCGFCDSGLVVRMTPLMSLFEGGSFFGGFDTAWIEDIAQGPNSSVYAVGITSTLITPLLSNTGGGAQPQPGGDDDAFVVRFAADLQVIFNASYLGGAKTEWGYSVAVDPVSGDVLAGGFSDSWNFPATLGGVQSFPSDGPVAGTASRDAFISRLSSTLGAFVRSTYYGGTYYETAYALSIGSDGDVYVAGTTDSSNAPGTAGGAQPAIGAFGSSDGFVARYDATLAGPASGLPHEYCVSGFTFNGCQATIAASANPSVSHATACTVTASNVEGQRLGLIFYSNLGRWGAPWCSSGGTSYLCVALPVQRTSVMNSGGTSGACDGSIVLSWNPWHVANPGAAGNLFTAGMVVDLQCWFRDPGSCKNTSLSNAVEVVMVP